MSDYAAVALGELFTAENGRPKYITSYVEDHPGPYPVFSASLLKPFGFIDSYDYDGTYLTWVMNGYGGRMQEVTGKFSLTRDRGVLCPKPGVHPPDLAYLRYVAEPELVAAAVGRRVDGRANDYTKIYSPAAEEIEIRLPMKGDGSLDYEKMAQLGARVRRIEAAQQLVKGAREPLERAVFPIHVAEPAWEISIGDETVFELSIGQRVLRGEFADTGVPVYSANALVPFGNVGKSNLDDFDRPSLLWGIDGVFDWNFIPAGEPFATTDHCGRLQLRDARLDPEYVFTYLKLTRERYTFDRVFRASLGNMRAEVVVVVPLDENGEPSLSRQEEIASELVARTSARESVQAALDDVLNARLALEL